MDRKVQQTVELEGSSDSSLPLDDAMTRLLDRPLAPDDLLEASERVRQPMAEPEKRTTRVLVFRERDEQLALPAGQIHRVTRPVRVHRIPHRSNKTIRGLCNIDGELVICVRLTSLLGLGPTESVDGSTGDTEDAATDRRMIVFGPEENRWVFEADAVLGVIPIDPSKSRKPPITVEGAYDHYTESLVEVETGDAALLDPKRVVAGFQAALS